MECITGLTKKETPFAWGQEQKESFNATLAAVLIPSYASTPTRIGHLSYTRTHLRNTPWAQCWHKFKTELNTSSTKIHIR
ncbi:hypothetical protein ACHAW6_004606 [Cyclotella cf. meneghiniana]